MSDDESVGGTFIRKAIQVVEVKLGTDLDDDIPFYIFNILLTERKSRLAVKFTTTDRAVFVQTFLPNDNFDSIKTIAAAVAGIKPKRLNHKVIKLKLMNNEVIELFKKDPHEALSLTIDSKTFLRRISLYCEYQELQVPDYICVTVKDSVTDMTRCVPVELYNRSIDKPWDGGYRSTNTGVEYYNAFSQTGPRSQKRGPELTSCRDTQTNVWCKNKKQDMSYSRATQMNRSDVFIPTITDRVLSPKPYETANERDARLDIPGKVRIMQRCFRAWKFQRCVKQLSQEYRRRQLASIRMEKEQIAEDQKRKRRDLICQVFPRSKADFSMLYAMSEKWKKGEIERINRTYCGPARLAELALLMDKEVQIFRDIDKLEQEVRRDNQRQNELKYLKKLGKPTSWYSSYKYLPVTIDSVENQIAREKDDFFQMLVDRNMSEPKKIDVLYELKLSLANDDCEIALDLKKLIDRAIGLLLRGFKNKDMETLQQRIEGTMLHHFKQHECFKALSVQQHIINKAEYTSSNLFRCNHCKQLKTIKSFKLNARTEKINLCDICKWQDKTIEPWLDISPYRFILKEIRRTERRYNCSASVSYIMQEKDIHHLVTKIWHSHSAVSECKDIYRLRLIRWERNVDWSPWNCILLTLEEAMAHSRIVGVNEVYEEEFRNHIFNKHALAKKHFKQLSSLGGRFKKLMYTDAFIDNSDMNGSSDFTKLFKVYRSKRLYF